jgi:hypothetical protein
MPTIAEKRVYDDRGERRSVLVACGTGVVAVDVSGDRVGRFGVDHRCVARDIEATGDALVVAADDDVLLGAYEAGEFGPAVAAGFDRRTDAAGTVVAAAPDGRLARRSADGEWDDLGDVGEARAVSGGMVAAADGVYRVGSDGLTHAGLADVRDVAADGVPLAATGGGLYRLGNGWMAVRDGAFDAVGIAPDGRAHAGGPDGLLVREGSEGADWSRVDLPVEAGVVDVAHGPELTVALTDEGGLLVTAGDGWRAEPLGLADPAGVVVR